MQVLKYERISYSYQDIVEILKKSYAVTLSDLICFKFVVKLF